MIFMFVSALKYQTLPSIPEMLEYPLVARHKQTLIVLSRERFTQDHSDGVWLYHTTNTKWNKQHTTNTPTLDEDVFVQHAWVYDNSLWLLCGEWYEQYFLYCLNLTTWQYQPQPMSGDAPVVSIRSTYWTNKNKVYAFSGRLLKEPTSVLPGETVKKNKYGKYIHNQLHRLTTTTHKWSHISFTGVPPPPRWDCSSTVVQHTTYVFGGYDGDVRFNDMHTFNNLTNTWTPIVCGGDVPGRRDDCALGTLTTHTLFMCGGRNYPTTFDDCWLFDTVTQTWKKANTTTHKPVEQHTMVDTGVSGELVVVGGRKTWYEGNWYQDVGVFTVR